MNLQKYQIWDKVNGCGLKIKMPEISKSPWKLNLKLDLAKFLDFHLNGDVVLDQAYLDYFEKQTETLQQKQIILSQT